MSAQRCFDCIHYDDEAGPEPEAGICRLHPPVIVVKPGTPYVPGDIGTRPTSSAWLWPRVKRTDWCGDWEAAG